MPTSIDPLPADDELECANCGAYFYYDLTRCPNCGINIYEPEETATRPAAPRRSLFAGLGDLFHHLFNKPYRADELFGTALNQAQLFNDLVRKVGGDTEVANRLVEFEQKQLPNGTRIRWIQNAAERWERDNTRYQQS